MNGRLPSQQVCGQLQVRGNGRYMEAGEMGRQEPHEHPAAG